MAFKRVKRDKYDITFSKFIKLRDKCCQKCGKSDGQLDCSHIFSRKHTGLRHHPKNAKLLCMRCHRWWHENPVEGAEWLKSVIGSIEYDKLRLSANQVTKMTKWDNDAIRKQLQDSIKAMENGEVLQPFNQSYG